MLRERRRHANFKPNRKLDRKSSRGMIYENEELRIRTININAEVERGQSDIKKLRRENYQLRKEIWSLRDEYDRLDKLLRSKNCNGSTDNGLGNDNDENGIDYDNDNDVKCDSCQSDEDSNSCDTCNEGEQSDEDRSHATEQSSKKKVQLNARPIRNHVNQSCGNSGTSTSILKQCRPEKMHLNFDHLSVVSEECLSNSDDQTEKDKRKKESSDEFIAETSVEQLSDSQTNVPPLSHFENLSYRDIGPNVDAQGLIYYNAEGYEMPNDTMQNDQNVSSIENVYELPPEQVNTASLEIDFLQSSSELEQKAGTSDCIPINFFSTIKPRDPIVIPPSATSTAGTIKKQSQVTPIIEPIYAEVSKKNKCSSPSTFQTGGNLEDLLLDIEHLSDDIEKMQFENNRIYDDPNLMKNTNGAEQPYRSEMNLILSFDGSRSTFVEKSNENLEEHIMPPEEHMETFSKVPLKMELLTHIKTNGEDENKESELLETDIRIPRISLPPVGICEKGKSASQNNNIAIATVRRHFSPQKSHASKKIIAEESNEKITDQEEQSNIPELVSKPCTPILERNIEPQPDILAIETVTPLKDTDTRLSETNDSVVENSKKKSARHVSICSNNEKIGKERDPTDQSENEDELSGKSRELCVPSLTTRRQTLTRKMSQDSLGHLHLPGSKSIFYSSSPTSVRRIRKSVPSSRRHSSDGLIQNATSHHHHRHGPNSSNYGHNHQSMYHHKDRDSYNETGAIISEKCSNSLASSRESSTSLSQRSSSQHKSTRKMSVSSHGQSNGKIPWCACWGNGCI